MAWGLVIRRAVYPRVCGGTVRDMATAPAWAGLSPRVRGNPTGARRQRMS